MNAHGPSRQKACRLEPPVTAMNRTIGDRRAHREASIDLVRRSPAMKSRQLVNDLGQVACLAATLICCSNAVGDDGCLYADNVESTSFSGCADDPLHLASQPAVLASIKALGLSGVPLTLIGCREAPFLTRPGKSPYARSYEILYPLGQKSIESYFSPITHELAHVFQSELAGGIGKLTLETRSLQRELGADFLTGVLFKNASNIAAIQFQMTVALMSLYRELDENAHGTPVQRNSAFRQGVYLKFSDFGKDFRKANDEFQENRYGSIASRP